LGNPSVDRACAGGGEQGGGEQALPDVQPRRREATTQCLLAIAQHDDRLVEDDLRGVSPAHVVGTDQATIPVQITPVLVGGPMVCTVVLMEGAGALEQQVGTGHESARAVDEADLRGDHDAEDAMEEPKQRLPGGLAPAVGGCESRPERRCPLAPRSRSPPDVVDGAQSEVKSGVDQNHQVEDSEPASAGKQRVGDRRHRNAIDESARRRSGVATHEQATSVGLDLAPDRTHRREERQAVGDRGQPEFVSAGRGKSGEHTACWKEREPRVELCECRIPAFEVSWRLDPVPELAPTSATATLREWLQHGPTIRSAPPPWRRTSHPLWTCSTKPATVDAWWLGKSGRVCAPELVLYGELSRTHFADQDQFRRRLAASQPPPPVGVRG